MDFRRLIDDGGFASIYRSHQKPPSCAPRPEITTSILGQLLEDVSGIEGIKQRDAQERADSSNAIQRAWSDV